MEVGEEKQLQDTFHSGMLQHLQNEFPYVCHIVHNVNSKGLWYGDDPLNSSLPLLLLQLSLISILTNSICMLLKPLGQPSIVSQLIGGVILGPSVLGRSSAFANEVFPIKGRSILETIALFGFMIFIFQVGVKIDPSIIMRSSKRAVSIGILGFCVPFAFAGIASFMLIQFVSMDPEVSRILPLVALIQSTTAFPVIACSLDELKILNSEIGRLASTSSIVCDACYWSVMILKFAAQLTSARSFGTCIASLVSIAMLILLIVFGVRPAALWAIRRTPEGKPVKEIYVYAVFITLLICGLVGEVIGVNAFVASFCLGLAIPDGPPLGAAVVERLDCFVSVLLMPILFTIGGCMMDLFTIQTYKNVGIIALVVFVAFFGKIIGTILPPLFCRMPFRDALSLGLIMNTKGVVEVFILIGWKKQNVMDEECFTLLIVSLLLITGIVSPIVKVLYDPSRRFLAYKRRTILHLRPDEDLRVLACICRQDSVLAIFNLLAASSPGKARTINLVVLHLVKLRGRASSLLSAHFPRETPSQHPTQSEQIFNAFRKFEEQYEGKIMLQCYKGISPYETMHNDVCSLALEKRTTFIILPFHKQWTIEGRVESSNVMRQLNKNVLDKAPCSVGILIDRRISRKFWSELLNQSPYHVAVLFFGGADDREALAYARRMLGQPNVLITLFCFSSSSSETCKVKERSRILDTQVLSEFRLDAFRNERVFYKDEVERDGIGVLALLESMQCEYDLVLVGRRHNESRSLSELGKRKEFGELGAVGEALAAQDIGVGTSLLIVQQQTRLWGVRHPEDGSSSTVNRLNV